MRPMFRWHGAKPAAVGACGHVFCEECMPRLAALEAAARRCPACRAPLRAADARRLFM